MGNLSNNQKILIEDLKDDIEFYKKELSSQIKSQRIYIGIGIVLALGVGILLLVFPEIITKLQSLSEHAGMVTGLIGETIPITFASKSFNSSKVQSKKLKGLRVFDKTLSRIENDILPNTEKDILNFENDLAVYINT